MTNQEFIKKIAAYVQKHAPAYGIKVYSPIIAQACLESAYGTSELATKANNYFGIKYHAGRCKTCVGVYHKVGSEQNKDGSYTSYAMKWCKFRNMENGVLGYFDFINVSRYSNLKGITGPKKYLQTIKADGYATSHKYVDNLMNVIDKWNLTQYDKKGASSTSTTSTIKITKKTATANTTASKNRSIQYIVIHYTAGTSSTSGKAANTAAYFAKSTSKASADFIVDDKNIVQYNPDIKNRYCWHCGGSKQKTKGGSLYGKAKNANSIGIEICSTNSTGKVKGANTSTWKFTDAVVSKAVELTKYLMKTYGIDAAHVIRHYDVTGKLCPGIVGWNADSGDESKWNAFKEELGTSNSSATPSTPKDNLYRVRKSWTNSKSQIGAYSILANAKAKVDQNPGYYVFDSSGKVVYPTSGSSTTAFKSYIVKLTTAPLNIRKGPGTNYAKTGSIKSIGKYTIVAESTGKGATKWGKLKSGAGWISLDYTKKV